MKQFVFLDRPHFAPNKLHAQPATSCDDQQENNAVVQIHIRDCRIERIHPLGFKVGLRRNALDSGPARVRWCLINLLAVRVPHSWVATTRCNSYSVLGLCLELQRHLGSP